MIKTIHLVNVKSYVDETIHFNDGINCILGLNGSGKSTIIEAIGMGLFNYNRYRNVSQMLRYKEKRGLIELDFVADDGRLYRVTRTLKPQSSTVKIADAQTGDVLEEGTENVYPFIKRLLHTSSTKEFSKMFEEIIAVPQGQFVTAFLQTPSFRKENFDKLFELHVYKDIANK
jgi:exonuclease SbcC